MKVVIVFVKITFRVHRGPHMAHPLLKEIRPNRPPRPTITFKAIVLLIIFIRVSHKILMLLRLLSV
jgi:hypothetical protein